MRVVYEILPHLNVNFNLYFLISVCKFECVSEFSQKFNNFVRIEKKLTNTFKLTHRNEQNTSKTS